MEQYLNYMLMIKNYLATLIIFLTDIAESFSETYNKRKMSNNQFHHCEANIFVEKFQNLQILKQILNLQVMIA